MRDFGVKVSILEPGFFKTPLVDEKRVTGMMERVWKRLSDDKKMEYGETYFQAGSPRKITSFFSDISDDIFQWKVWPPICWLELHRSAPTWSSTPTFIPSPPYSPENVITSDMMPTFGKKQVWWEVALNPPFIPGSFHLRCCRQMCRISSTYLCSRFSECRSLHQCSKEEAVCRCRRWKRKRVLIERSFEHLQCLVFSSCFQC